jgi:hypothetical protein
VNFKCVRPFNRHHPKQQNEFRVSRVNPCPDSDNSIVQFKDLNILSLVDKIVVNGEIIVSEDTTGKLTVMIQKNPETKRRYFLNHYRAK